jgi:acyl carrier protein
MAMNICANIENFILRELLVGDGRAGLESDESLISNGVIDSLGILRLVAFLEEEFTIRVEDDEVIPENFQTINAMRELVESKLK